MYFLRKRLIVDMLVYYYSKNEVIWERILGGSGYDRKISDIGVLKLEYES